jgi:hypothetical protein
MAFVIWYRVEITGGAPGPTVTASNDILGAQWLCDADLTLTMLDGTGGGTFSIELKNLPAAEGTGLKDRRAHAPDGQPLTITSYLGYFDDVPLIRRPTAVMTGAVTDVRTSVADDGTLSTILTGQELATWQLLRLQNISKPYSDAVTPAQVLTDVLSGTGVSSQGAANGGASRDHFTFHASDGLDAVDQIARWASVQAVLRDGKVVIGDPAASTPGPTVDENVNAVTIDTALSAANVPRTRASGVNANARDRSARVYDVTALGDNQVRAGHLITVKITGEQQRQLRVQRVEHHFSTATTGGGYTCAMRLVEPNQANPPPFAGAHGVVRRMRDLTDTARDAHPNIDVGEITGYETGSDGKHLVTLNYGQTPGPDVVEPSVQTPVDSTSHLSHKPIASAFAWDKCGLIVPAYAGQRALLAHNRGDANDAAVIGYLWSEDPAYARPKNQAGDWWLCLPTELQGGKPAGKGVNDLTDATGLRVIQAKGLRITVGSDTLPAVGDRPDLPDADKLKIEHKSGTTVTIDTDGSVAVTTSQKDVQLTNGQVTLKLSGSAVDVS